MNMPNPAAFAERWAAAWNARDVEAVLADFHDDAVFTSPIAQRLGHGDDGRVAGKAAIREYWRAAMARNPALHFDVTRVFAGVDILIIVYRTQDGTDRSEVLQFRDGLIVAGHGSFAADA